MESKIEIIFNAIDLSGFKWTPENFGYRILPCYFLSEPLEDVGNSLMEKKRMCRFDDDQPAEWETDIIICQQCNDDLFPDETYYIGGVGVICYHCHRCIVDGKHNYL